MYIFHYFLGTNNSKMFLSSRSGVHHKIGYVIDPRNKTDPIFRSM